EYCNNLEYAMWYGDKESGRLFDSDCNNVDSFFVTQNYSKADAQNYFYKLRFVKSKYSSQQEFYRYDKENNLDLAYEIYKNDTSYIKLPKQYMDSVVKLIMNPINKTIANNCVYPKESKNHNISGTVYVQFYINKVGKVETTRIMRAPMYGEALAIETLNLFSLLPQFKPFIYQGRPIRLKLQLPVKFTLK
ncbi:MAG TPA: energy transducer TonB, partial [Bacteroidia bacterium]